MVCDANSLEIYLFWIHVAVAAAAVVVVAYDDWDVDLSADCHDGLDCDDYCCYDNRYAYDCCSDAYCDSGADCSAVREGCCNSNGDPVDDDCSLDCSCVDSSDCDDAV